MPDDPFTLPGTLPPEMEEAYQGVVNKLASSLATERAVSATLVRQIQAVRDLKPLRMGLGADGCEYLDRQQVLRLLSPQNDASG